MLYQSEIAADAATRTALEKQFITASMEAMKIFLGCAPPKTPCHCVRIGNSVWARSFGGRR